LAPNKKGFAMTAIVYRFVLQSIRPSIHVSDIAVVSAFSMGGLVLTLVMIHFGLDYGAGISG
jgi:hypothetical protein